MTGSIRRSTLMVLASLTLISGRTYFLFPDVPAAARKEGPKVSTDLLRLEFRNIGPALMGGRIDDFAVNEADPRQFFVATASGGILKTSNNGVTFESVFDGQDSSSIGAIAIAPSNPSIVYAGTGEANNRQS